MEDEPGTSTIDIYKLFGLQSNAHPDTIKEIYKKRLRQLHPDKNKNASETQRFLNHKELIQLNRAYEILSNPAKRAKHDNLFVKQHTALKTEYESDAYAQLGHASSSTQKAIGYSHTGYTAKPPQEKDMFGGGGFSIDKFNQAFEKRNKSENNHIPHGYIQDTEHITHTDYNPDVDSLLAVPARDLTPHARTNPNELEDGALQGFDLHGGGGLLSSEIAVSGNMMVDNDSGLLNSESVSGFSDYAQAFQAPLMIMDNDPTTKSSVLFAQAMAERENVIAPTKISEADMINKQNLRNERIMKQHTEQVKHSSQFLEYNNNIDVPPR